MSFGNTSPSKGAFAAGADLQDKSDHQQLLKRLTAFAEEALVPHSGGSPALLALVRKLQAGLAFVEKFPVQYSQLAPASSLRAFGSGAAAGAETMSESSQLHALDIAYLSLCISISGKSFSANVIRGDTSLEYHHRHCVLCPKLRLFMHNSRLVY